MTQSPSDDARASPKPAAKPRKKTAKPATAERARVGGARAIADLMPEIGGAAFRRFGFIQSSIVTRWAEIAGARHASLSTPESIRFPAGKKSDGTLQLIVTSGHAPIIQHVIPELIERVNRFFGYGAVARIAIRHGEVRPQPPVDRPLPRMLRPVSQEVGEGLRDIGDPELRAVLEAMASGLTGPVAPPRIS